MIVAPDMARSTRRTIAPYATRPAKKRTGISRSRTRGDAIAAGDRFEFGVRNIQRCWRAIAHRARERELTTRINLRYQVGPGRHHSQQTPTPTLGWTQQQSSRQTQPKEADAARWRPPPTSGVLHARETSCSARGAERPSTRTAALRRRNGRLFHTDFVTGAHSEMGKHPVFTEPMALRPGASRQRRTSARSFVPRSQWRPARRDRSARPSTRSMASKLYDAGSLGASFDKDGTASGVSNPTRRRSRWTRNVGLTMSHHKHNNFTPPVEVGAGRRPIRAASREGERLRGFSKQ